MAVYARSVQSKSKAKESQLRDIQEIDDCLRDLKDVTDEIKLAPSERKKILKRYKAFSQKREKTQQKTQLSIRLRNLANRRKQSVHQIVLQALLEFLDRNEGTKNGRKNSRKLS